MIPRDTVIHDQDAKSRVERGPRIKVRTKAYGKKSDAYRPMTQAELIKYLRDAR